MTADPSAKARRRSPPTDRVVQVLDLLAEDPVHGYSITDVVKSLGIANATCHAILSSLVESRLLKRDAVTKRYYLASHLFSLGCAARKSIEGGAPIENLLVDLSLETGCPCSAHALDEEGKLLVLHNLKVHGSPEGHEYLLAPPFGFSFVPWGPESLLTDWLSRSALPIGRDDLSKLRKIIKSARREGYLAYGMLSDLQVKLFAALSEHRADEITDVQQQKLLVPVLQGIWIRGIDLADYRRNSKLGVSSVVAPVFGRKGELRMVIHLYLNKSDISVPELESYGLRVKQTADELTAYFADQFRRPLTRP